MLVVLLTDFGLQDHYVGVMKGVLKSFAPEVEIIDLTHEVSPQNIEEALWKLYFSYKYFPEGTCFLSVVDPGVGTRRKILVVEAKKRLFIAPDNGLLSPFIEFADKVWALKDGVKFFSETSSTFHGRDLFAPLAASLVKDEKNKKLFLESTTDYKIISYKAVKTKDCISGKMVYADRFGNIITNISFEDVDFPYFKVFIGDMEIKDSYSNYAEASEGKLFFVWGSSGMLEISLKNSSALEFCKSRGVELTKIEVRSNGG